MPSKHPSHPAPSIEDRSDEASKKGGSPENPAPGEPILDDEEKPTEPMRRRSPAGAPGPGVRAAVKADGDQE